MNTLVMKFGGAAVATIEGFFDIVQIIISRLKEYKRIIIVVSAMGETTNQLIEMAKKVHPNPPQREYDMLTSAGERISMALLAMALCHENVEAMSFTGSQSGIITSDRHANAQIVNVRPQRLEECLNQGKVAIVAGFQGVSLNKEITTLGRGGSDTTAVALGIALGAAKVEFFKDVKGIFNQDPKINSKALFYETLTYQEALEIAQTGAKVLHPRAITLAAKNYLPLQVRSFISLDSEGTLIYQQCARTQQNPCYEEV